jgi:hypothetical protein
MTKMVETVGQNNGVVVTVDTNIAPAEFKLFNDWKVITNNVGGWKELGALKVVGPQVGCSYSTVMLLAHSENEANNITAVLSSKVYRYAVQFAKNNTPNSKTVFSNLPTVDFTKRWTDAELYEHFKLTDEEIALIEATVG